MLVTSARRPSTETHKGVQALVAGVVKQAIEGYSWQFDKPPLPSVRPKR
jgi:hypothetical protein